MRYLIVLMTIIFAQPLQAEFSIQDFLYKSAVETDRLQSYNWWWATPDNSASTGNPRMNVFEGNPLVAGTSIDNFHQSVMLAKYLPDVIDEVIDNKGLSRALRTGITVIELANVIKNAVKMENLYYLPQEVMLSVEIKF